MTLNSPFMLENPQNVAELKQFCNVESGPKYLHSDVSDSLPVIANAWLQLSLQRVALQRVALYPKLNPYYLEYCSDALFEA